jgi:hypothetical protein
MIPAPVKMDGVEQTAPTTLENATYGAMAVRVTAMKTAFTAFVKHTEHMTARVYAMMNGRESRAMSDASHVTHHVSTASAQTTTSVTPAILAMP